jgi:type III restriction enzyme
MIWLIEAPPVERMGLEIPPDEPTNPESKAKGYGPLLRYACKMATGSGKTVVMGMLIAWSVLNKLHNPQDRRFSDAVLVVCPNLTVKERLAVLYPNRPGNYYEAFDLVPRSLLKLLGEGKYSITNWQALAPKEDPRRSVVRRGRESDWAFCKRVLRDLSGKETSWCSMMRLTMRTGPPNPSPPGSPDRVSGGVRGSGGSGY